MHNQPLRGDVLSHVGRNLRRLRQRTGMSQAALADASGLSRRMIVNVEGGDTNISLSSLDRLAEALGVGFVDIVSDPEAETRRLDALVWRGADPASIGMIQASTPARKEAQLWSWSLGVGDRYAAEPDPEGWHEMVSVTAGRLRITLAEGPLTIEAGDYAVYSSAQAYAYENAATEITRFVRVVVC